MLDLGSSFFLPITAMQTKILRHLKIFLVFRDSISLKHLNSNIVLLLGLLGDIEYSSAMLKQ